MTWYKELLILFACVILVGGLLLLKKHNSQRFNQNIQNVILISFWLIFVDIVITWLLNQFDIFMVGMTFCVCFAISAVPKYLWRRKDPEEAQQIGRANDDYSAIDGEFFLEEMARAKGREVRLCREDSEEEEIDDLNDDLPDDDEEDE
jgi:hypothetical protein